MSKVDAMQAMREARYAARATAGQGTPVPPSPLRVRSLPINADDPGKAPAAAGPAAQESTSTVIPEETEQAEALCGHRSMNNRNCRRPAGHAEKNHRYG